MRDSTEYEDCYITRSKSCDAAELYSNLRKADIDECFGLGVHPREACLGSVGNGNKSFTMRSNEDDNPLIACFGVGHQLPNVGCIWMLGTDRVKSVSTTFLRHSREWVQYLIEGYDYVSNIVSVKNAVSIRWLKWVGAEFIKKYPQGYQEFIIRRN